ncbi:MAG: hypothetical protein QM831_13205 [Kofleriaceae bacterium]
MKRTAKKMILPMIALGMMATMMLVEAVRRPSHAAHSVQARTSPVHTR